MVKEISEELSIGQTETLTPLKKSKDLKGLINISLLLGHLILAILMMI